MIRLAGERERRTEISDRTVSGNKERSIFIASYAEFVGVGKQGQRFEAIFFFFRDERLEGNWNTRTRSRIEPRNEMESCSFANDSSVLACAKSIEGLTRSGSVFRVSRQRTSRSWTL